MKTTLAQLSSRSSPWGRFAAAAGLLALAAPAGATDGAYTTPEDYPTYYEEEMGGTSPDAFVEPASPLPTRLAVDEGSAQVSYHRIESSPPTWQVRIDGFERRHERVRAVYDMILVLPLPEDADGRDAFEALDRGVLLQEGSPEQSVAFIYAGEKLRLKRNVALEKTLIPRIVGPEAGQLPDIRGSGYRYTAWDTIVKHDPDYGPTVQGLARLRYTTDPGVGTPDPADPRMAGWWITWIPSLATEIDPYAVRMDVVPAAE